MIDDLNYAGLSEGDLAEVESPPVDPRAAEKERRSHQCRHDGCTSEAVWQVYLHLRYGWQLVAIETLESTLRVCDKHRKSANDFLLSDSNKTRVAVELAKHGRLNIDWPRAMVEFVPIGDKPWGPGQMRYLGPMGRA